MKIEKKIWPKYFEKIKSGDKTFELRLGDFECSPGDVLLLKEWNPETKQYTGRQIEKEVSYCARTKNVPFWSKEDIDKYGFLIMGFK